MRFKSIRLKTKILNTKIGKASTKSVNKIDALFYEMIKKNIRKIKKQIKLSNKLVKNDIVSLYFLEQRLDTLSIKLKCIAKMYKKKALSVKDISSARDVFSNEICYTTSFDLPANGETDTNLTCVVCLDSFCPQQVTSIIGACCKQCNYCGIIFN